ncbi:host attachment protein [Candidatus Odyssella thessalonicensis]|uniref:host attachment protein n=1 Tax=Candidatus Odyssella thessalonicensis TaxID=84647 RepID=UPI000225A8DE|nr:host attachment protein [Candidatus Odyssella thessalonicensis]
MILLVVCDGAQAKLFKKAARFGSLEHLKSFSHSHELTHEHGRDKPGRGFGSAADHHAYEPATDWHESQKFVFAQEISSYIIDLINNKTISKIYFISPPKIAHVFKEALKNHMDTLHRNNLNITEIHKDLIHATVDEIDTTVMKEDGWK